MNLRYITISDPEKRPTAVIHIEDAPFTDVSHTRCGRQFYSVEVFEHVAEPEDAYGAKCQRCFRAHAT